MDDFIPILQDFIINNFILSCAIYVGGVMLLGVISSLISSAKSAAKYNERKEKGLCTSCGGEGKVISYFFYGPDPDEVIEPCSDCEAGKIYAASLDDD